ncbi:MAG: hypothetical protein IJW37_09110 [Lachnospiraceae bacterium]|nr:hypothetical protein [Lachnospiraceae bacterium]
MKKGSFAIRLFLYASVFSLVWLGAYVGLSGAFAVAEPSDKKAELTPTPVPTLPNPVSSYWSVFGVADEEGTVTEFVLQYADFLADTLVFVEVPTDTKAELSAGAYEVLSVHNPEIPELFMISELCEIFSEETLCMAATEVAAGFLGERPKACYILEEDTYRSLVEETKEGGRFFIPDSVRDTILTVFEHAVTDRTPEEELVYVESYRDVEELYYYTLPGTATAQEYVPDRVGIKEMVEAYRGGQFAKDE